MRAARTWCIAKVGTLSQQEAEWLLAKAAAGSVLDCRGLLVLPGLIDAHVHAIATGMTLLGVHLSACTSLEELAQAIAQAAAASADFVRLSGLDLSRLNLKNGEQLDRAWLDGQLSSQPLVIKSVEGHASWFNTRAWTRLGITKCWLRSARRRRSRRGCGSAGA